ncbi:unnamed protein product [Prorocentrum cordatum]|uniref:Uncharacterized protein n=1 Tax=Prorocentrum cordatum TaxID=2364126 RepID=A0ABN9Y0C2_9DINO|nr:unnamed protein product [Polarella glacialis]
MREVEESMQLGLIAAPAERGLALPSPSPLRCGQRPALQGEVLGGATVPQLTQTGPQWRQAQRRGRALEPSLEVGGAEVAQQRVGRQGARQRRERPRGPRGPRPSGANSPHASVFPGCSVATSPSRIPRADFAAPAFGTVGATWRARSLVSSRGQQ